MIFPICVPRQNCKDELKQIQAEVRQVKNNMPIKSAFQEELVRLQDQAIQNEATIKSQANFISRLISLNEKLIEYIDNIEEIKNAGGVKNAFVSREDFCEPRTLRMKTVTIPEVKVAMLEDV